MKRWLDGDLSGVEPRKELELLRALVADASRDGTPLTAFWRGLGAHDAVAAAELAAGPRAVAHPHAVRASLEIVEVLEGVLAPTGLYRRLVVLAPEAAPEVIAAAVRRHGAVGWLATLCRHEPAPGRTALDVAPSRALVDLLAREGVTEGLEVWAVETGNLYTLAALYRSGRLAACQHVAAAMLDAQPTTPVAAWLAAVHGPDLDPLLVGIVEKLTNPGAARVLHSAWAEYGATRLRLAEVGGTD